MKTRIKSFVYIYVQSKRKAKRFISGTCGRIKPDVSDVNSGPHMSLFGSINSRKAENDKKTNVLKKGMISCAKF